MKKVVALLLALIMLASMMLTPTAFADTAASDELEKVLLAVKAKIDIPSELSEFESDVAKYGEQVCYNFDWHDPSYEKSITVGADGSGRVTNYYNYSFKISDKKLSGVSKSEIIAFADSFLKKTLPEMYMDSTDVLVFDEESYSAGGSLRYSLTYNRYKNSIPVKDNYANITVCISEDDTLYVRNMSANINYDTAFAAKPGEISDFVQRYTEAFPIELVYQNEYNYDWKVKNEPRTAPVLIYRIKDNNAGFISAETGEVIEEDTADGVFRQESMSDMAAGSTAEKNEALTEKELGEITAVEGLLSTEETEKKIKALPYVQFPGELKLENSSLSKNESGEYMYNLYYTNKDDGDYRYLHLSAYAKSGKLISFYQSCDMASRKDVTLTELQKKAAEEKISAFLTAAAEEFKSTELEKSEEKNGYVSSYYYRTVNGVKHVSNGIDITFDAKNSVVTRFSLDFTEGEFADPAKAIGEKAAYDKLIAYSPVIKMYVKSGGRYTECLTLEKRGVTLNALTGEIKNSYEEENTSFSYSDIKGHWVEEAATKLAEIQVGIEGDKLSPDTAITQEELLRLLSSGIYGKYYHAYSQDDLYEAMIREKIITGEEKNPSAAVTREEAFVYTIRMANLEKVAKLENIYKIDYADSALLSEGKLGYCAILSGLGVICGHGGYLRPTDNLTRAEAVIMLYRYLLTI